MKIRNITGETGRVGISYQTYVETLFLIEARLPRYEQIVEEDLLLEARKKQFVCGLQYLSTVV